MTEFYHDDWLTIYQGDARAVLPELASDSVDCIVTSPPYWGLRDYGTATWAGGSEDCDHKMRETRAPHERKASTLGGGTDTVRVQEEAGATYKDVCGKCGAVRQDAQLGLERTPEEYVANLVAVFRELRRVLKPTGTAWLNLGDSYAGSGKGGNPEGSEWSGFVGSAGREKAAKAAPPIVPSGLKPKDLVGIPWRVAFALQADGWYLRSDIIWAKPNPMPESVTDRPTKAHEYLFLLTKSARYYFDADAVREAAVRPGDVQTFGGAKARNGEPIPVDDPRYRNGKEQWGRTIESGLNGRNLRSVWTIATRPYPGAHFAVFPPELPERCIKAGSSERGVCPDCGAPWERVVERTPPTISGYTAKAEAARDQGRNRGASTIGQNRAWGPEDHQRSTTGWRRGCTHYAETWQPVPAVVLDPFAGSGTTGMVANRLSRRAILIDLNGDYLKQQLKRNAQTPLGLGA